MSKTEEFIIKSEIESLRHYIKLVELKLDLLSEKIERGIDSKIDKK